MAENKELKLDIEKANQEIKHTKHVCVVTPTHTYNKDIYTISVDQDTDSVKDSVFKKKRVRADSDLTTYKKSNIGALLCIQFSKEIARLCCGVCVVMGLGISICVMIYLWSVYF